jgi:hypothetical protein
MKHETSQRPLTTYEKVERIVFLCALVVFFLDLLWWRP